MAQVIFNLVGLAAELSVGGSDYTGPVSYVTGGMTVSSTTFGMKLGVYSVIPMDASVSGTYFLRVWSPGAPRVPTVKIQWFVKATGLEVGNGTNLSAEKFRIVAFGV